VSGNVVKYWSNCVDVFARHVAIYHRHNVIPRRIENLDVLCFIERRREPAHGINETGAERTPFSTSARNTSTVTLTSALPFLIEQTF
jgi:hypothetical protein